MTSLSCFIGFITIITIATCLIAFYTKSRKAEFAYYVSAVFLVVTIALLFILELSNIIFMGYANDPYGLDFKDCIGLVTQVITFLGSTSLAVITFLYNKSKDQKQDKQSINEDSKSE